MSNSGTLIIREKLGIIMNGYQAIVYDMEKGGNNHSQRDRIWPIDNVTALEEFLTGIQITESQEAQLWVSVNSEWHRSFVFYPKLFGGASSQEHLGVCIQGEEEQMHIAYVPILHSVIKDAQGKFTPEKCKTHMEYCEGLEPQEMRDQIYQDFIYEYTEESMSKRGLTDSPSIIRHCDCLQRTLR